MRQAMIFAAGLGTRLRPLTDKKPKALVEVGGKPLLEHVLNRLKAAGFERVVVNVHHFAQQIVDYINNLHYEGMNIYISDESEELLETGGGLRKAAILFDTQSPVLIHNVDIFSNVDLCDIYDSTTSSFATLLVSNRNTNRYLLFDSNMHLVGWTNVSTGEVRSPIKDLKVECCHRYAFSGIHVISPSMFEVMKDWPDRFSIIDFYLSICDKYPIEGYLKSDLRLLDVGKVDTLTEAEHFIAQL